MRFSALGPNIPDELLEACDNGNVVFFCGAGVSRRAGLPGFLDLVRQVVDALRPPSESKVRILLKRIEEDPDIAPPLDQMFSVFQQDYGVAHIEDLVSQLLKTPPRANLDQHSIVLRLSRSANHQSQLVTTNFDLLFEKAKGALQVHVPPALPDIASGQPLEGLIYLHGRRA